MLHVILSATLFGTLVVDVNAGRALKVTFTPDDERWWAGGLSKLSQILGQSPPTATFTDFATVFACFDGANKDWINGYIVPEPDFEAKFSKSPKRKWTVTCQGADGSVTDTIQNATVRSNFLGIEEKLREQRYGRVGYFKWQGRHSGQCILTSKTEDSEGEPYYFLFDQSKLLKGFDIMSPRKESV